MPSSSIDHKVLQNSLQWWLGIDPTSITDPNEQVKISSNTGDLVQPYQQI